MKIHRIILNQTLRTYQHQDTAFSMKIVINPLFYRTRALLFYFFPSVGCGKIHNITAVCK